MNYCVCTRFTADRVCIRNYAFLYGQGHALLRTRMKLRRESNVMGKEKNAAGQVNLKLLGWPVVSDLPILFLSHDNRYDFIF